MTYFHQQRGKLHYLFLGVALAMAVTLVWVRGPAVAVVVAVALVLVLCSFCFSTLTVRDAGDALSLAYGPLPLFRKRLPYSGMRVARPGRCHWIDGLGIHWIPTRGWIYNLWGRDCVEIECVDQVVRIGTDDARGLAAFLQQRIPAP